MNIFAPCIKFKQNVCQLDTGMTPFTVMYEHFNPPYLHKVCKGLKPYAFINVPLDVNNDGKSIFELEINGFYGVYVWEYCGDEHCKNGCQYLDSKEEYNTEFAEFLSILQELFCGEERECELIEVALKKLWQVLGLVVIDGASLVVLSRALKGQYGLAKDVITLIQKSKFREAASAIAVRSKFKEGKKAEVFWSDVSTID